MSTDNLTPEEQAEFDKVLKGLHSVRRLTQEEILQVLPSGDLGRIIQRIGSKMWVVVDSSGRTCAMDPTTRLPFRTKNKKFAELVAKEMGGVAMSYNEALRVISERNRPND